MRLQEDEELEHGTPTVVIVTVPRGQHLSIESLVWHSRRLKPRRSEKAAWVFGLVVANPSEAYLKLVAEHTAARTARFRPAVSAQPPVAQTPSPVAAPTPTAGPVWRVRLQLSGSPRSRTILVETESAENAAARALEEAGAHWIVLEVTEA